MQVPDPDIFYEGEGLMVTLSVYESLVRYAPVAADQNEVLKQYTASANRVRDAGVVLNIANQEDVIVSRAGITNFVHDPMGLQMIRLADLKRT